MKLELSTRTDIALRAVRYLDEAGERHTTAEVADAIDAPPQFLAHVMASLVKAGWVRSTRGPGGGYLLRADAGALSLRQLIEVVEGPTDDGRCVLEDAACGSTSHCALHVPWQRARAALLEELDRTPLRAGPEVKA